MKNISKPDLLFFAFFLLISIVFSACGAGSKEPEIGGWVALRPVIELVSGEEYRAGTCFVARFAPDSDPVLLTALHIFGPDGGLSSQIPSSGLASHIFIIRFESMNESEEILGSAMHSLIQTGYPYRNEDVSGDVAAFRVIKGADMVDILNLADTDPHAGETVWIVGDEFSSIIPKQRLWKAEVSEITPGHIALYPKDDFDLSGFSGAPVINAKKEIVGMVCSHYYEYILVNSAANIRSHLEKNR